MKAIEILNRCRAADAEINRIQQRIEQRNSALYRITAGRMDANSSSRVSGNHDKIGTLEADIDTLKRQLLARKRSKQVEMAAACALLDYLDAASSDVLYRFYVLGETTAAIAAARGYQDGTVRAKKAEALKILAEIDSTRIDATLPGWYLRGEKDGSNFDSKDFSERREQGTPSV